MTEAGTIFVYDPTAKANVPEQDDSSGCASPLALIAVLEPGLDGLGGLDVLVARPVRVKAQFVDLGQLFLALLLEST